MGATALHAAVRRANRSALAVLLIEAGAAVDLKDKVSPEHAWLRGEVVTVCGLWCVAM